MASVIFLSIRARKLYTHKVTLVHIGSAVLARTGINGLRERRPLTEHDGGDGQDLLDSAGRRQ